MDRWILVLASAFHLSMSGGNLFAQDSPGIEGSPAPIFHDLRRLRFNEVYHQLREVKPQNPNHWGHVNFGLAVAALNRQPRSEKTIAEAEALFEAVRAADPAHDLGVASAYFIARIVQIHRFDPDEAEAGRMFRALSLAFPEHYFGQLAFLNYATIDIYRQPGAAAIGQALYRLEEEGGFLTVPDVKRNFLRLLGETHVYYDISPRKGEDFFVAAMEVGFIRPGLRAKMLLRVAELARKRGDVATARKYYETLLAEFVRSRYRYITQKRLESLDMENTGAAH